MVIFTGLAEEPGWRGYALPRLQKYFTAEKASWILGFLWGAWHIPVIIYLNRDAPLFATLFSIVGLLLGTVGWTMLNTWLYNSTGSVFLIILLHGWGNAVQSYLVLSTGNMLAMTAYGVLPWVLAVFIEKKYGKDNLAATPRLMA
jgi:membrane protease YdiL (CAAX protease family)